ncbi:MAG: peptidylprolyl isomerase [Planctomycetota bacterium]|jgi:peptidyl-prolyl cis-trans isomerase B (cyclophilin B)
MTASVRATSASLVLLLVVAVAGAEEEKKRGTPTLLVPAGQVPRIDGIVAADEWQDGAPFDVRRGEHVLGQGRIKRSGRQLFLSLRSDLHPWGLGVRFDFADPVSQRRNPVLVMPLNPPRPPIAAFRRVQGRDPEPLSCAICDVRFTFPGTGGFTMELRLPMELVEFSRSAKGYYFSVELWDLGASRTLGVYPYATAAVGGSPAMARLEATDTWGAETVDDEETEQPGLKLLEELATVAGTLQESAGWRDGRRKDPPLAKLQQRLDQAIAAYPDYVSLRAAGVQVRVARNDLAGGLAALDRLGADFVPVATTPRHLIIRTEFLRNLERPDEALALLDAHPEPLKDDPLAARERLVIGSLRESLRMEQEIRKREAEKDDLPRVSVKTSKGQFLLELFEDDAPNAVANFISLAERGFYDGTRFFWCEGGRRMLGGDPNTRDEDPHNDGFGDPGYLIEAEPSRRLNLAYMVAFADKRRTRRSEGCTFLIHLAPFPALDGLNSVFGRIIEGYATVRKLEYYDVIEATKVVRKRDHAYEPIKRP